MQKLCEDSVKLSENYRRNIQNMSEDYAKNIVWKLRCKSYTKLYETTRQRCENYTNISKEHPENYTKNCVKAMKKRTQTRQTLFENYLKSV